MSASPIASPPRTVDFVEVDPVLRTLEAVRRRLRDVEARIPLASFGPAQESARNLLHYVALRHFDLRKVQSQLEDLGLSSLGRAEGHVLYNLEAVLTQLYAFGGRPPPAELAAPAIGPEEGRSRIARNAARLFGRSRPGRDTRIMVTAPIEVAHDRQLVRELLESGMDCLRINCAHDSPDDWLRMIQNLRAAERRTGQRCRVEMDLGGPRLRTGDIEPGPAALKVRPPKDPMGRPTGRAQIDLLADSRPPRPREGSEAHVSVASSWLRRRRAGELLHFRDARGARRTLRLDARGGGWARASLDRTAYFTNGLRLRARHANGRTDVVTVEGIPTRPGRIRLRPGDRFRLSTRPSMGHGPRGRGRGGAGTIGVTIPDVLRRVRPGHRVWFDAGRIGGIVRRRSSTGVVLEITHAAPNGSWLKGDQGINLPDTDLGLPALTERDRDDLRFIAQHSDLVGYSFVTAPRDIEVLRAELRRLGRPRMGVILKIETRRAFEELPAILLSGLRSGPVGVMVARGDLAMEVGFERLAEVQEETLWLCEAAHLPTVWATEVLEGLAKSGVPTRAEVTDAAMGERAECVMLNKGPYLVSAVRALDSILRRMQAHQGKKSARLRHLNVAERFLLRSAPGGSSEAPRTGRGRRTESRVGPPAPSSRTLVAPEPTAI